MTLRVAVALAAVSAVSGAVAPGAQAGLPVPGPRTRYAAVRHVCRSPKPRHASCLVEALVPAPASATGASPYLAAAGAASSGPAGGLTPAELASAYAYSPAGGGGQAVAIVDAFDDPKIEADLASFDAHYGLSSCTAANGCFEKVGQTGSTTSLPHADTVGWSVEITLDVETVHSVCESCKIMLVEANSESFADLAASVSEAVKRGAGEVSNSYGGLESGVGASESAAYNTPGVVMVASAGDSGYLNWDYVASVGTAPGQPDSPASLPTVVAVGGTALKLTAAGTRQSETVWNDSGRPSVEEFKQFSATGGGCSGRYTAPSWQQSVPGWAATGCGTKRLDNDIAAVADPYTGFDIYDSYVYEAGFKPGWLTVGGTSLSSPLVAALYGLAGGSNGVSYPASTLYAHIGQPSALYDVTEGGDGYCDGEAPGPCGEPEVNELLGKLDCEGTTACDAALGFDGPSGVGAPNGLGALESKKLAPTVAAEAASAPQPTSAVLSGTVNPNGQIVGACVFEYGPTASYGLSAPCSSLPAPGSSPVPVSASLLGLSPGSTYHFRLVASNPTGEGEGVDEAFTTGSPPEYGRCEKLAKGVKGAYSTATCTSLATAEKYSYEWAPGPGPKAKFTATLKPLSTAVIETLARTDVTCTGASAGGEYVGRKTVASVIVTFTGCTRAGVKCTSAGRSEGEVVTSALVGSLGVVSKSGEGPLKDAIGADLSPSSESVPVASFTCGASTVSVKGSVLDPVTSDKMLTKVTVKYAAAMGRQKPEGFEGLPRDVLEEAVGEAAFEQAALKLTMTETGEEPLEVNSVE
ncbi:MAG TPA: S53 family peptidase [Solirubrobacteraceae bacterium]|nr:S53 family peptidase [Solirubrobacteraceae bacterium]